MKSTLKPLLFLGLNSFIISACVSTTPLQSLINSDPKLFQANEKNKELVTFMRDEKLCKEELSNKKKCPINLYIDDFKAGTFYVNNTQKYYLEPNKYTIKVKNCTVDCETTQFEIDLTDQLQKKQFTLSIDNDDRPFITQK
jgi:hypothetical protein